MRKLFASFGLLATLAGCAQVQTFGMAAIEQRRQMNDMQARATLAATCDIALGAYFRELSEVERQYAALVCGGQFPDVSAVSP
ncbi:MAG TPA: hypothetical protein ENJ83_04300 [Rhodospirillales bacterium]|nr:hypothetical protein [Rhodospirillales bacterium]